ncbi:peptidase family M48-domain-containing protein [Blastocladiella britannica]|nr:peptidase family M48-domain-containing protein [Blastocladiella britannica]
MYGVGIFTVGSGAYYVAHLEEVPLSGRRRFMDCTPEMESLMAKEAYSEIMAEYKGRFLPSYHPYSLMVKKVAQRIVQAAGMEDVGWEFHVIDSKELNAFVLPGGKVFVFTGILPVCGNESGLAAVLGHEIAHQLARHSAEKMSFTKILMLGQIMISVVFDASMSLSRMITQLGVLLPFSRKMENEADQIGLLLMAQACYDPREAVGFWRRMAEASKGGPPEFLSTHPASGSRIERIEKQLPAAMDRLNSSDCHTSLGYLADMFRTTFSKW